ncbi:MAG: RCC1 domain-containing protein [Polyangiales bacterium]
MAIPTRTGARSDGVIEVPDVVEGEAGSNHTCVLDASGRVLCWGTRSARGQNLDSCPWQTPPTTHRRSGRGRPRRHRRRRKRRVCIDGDGAVRCWGWGGLGQLGNGRMNEDIYREPLRVLGFGDPASSGP